MQDLNDLAYFAEVVDRAGFAAAGRALGIPKSRLSRRVSELEARLGVRLLQRTTRKLSLTAVGEQFYRHCVAMREDVQAAEEAVAQARSEPRGTLRIACPVTLAQSMLGPILPRFMAQYPGIRVDMSVSNRAVDLIEEGFDVALRVRPTLEDSATLVVKNFGLTATVLVASPVQLARQGRPGTVDELAQLDTMAMSSADGRATLSLVGPGGTTHLVQHTPRYVADDLLTLKFAALAGTGMCALPDYMCRGEIRAGLLEEVLPGWAPRPGIFHAVFPSRRGLLPGVRKFLDFLAEAAPAGFEQ